MMQRAMFIRLLIGVFILTVIFGTFIDASAYVVWGDKIVSKLNRIFYAPVVDLISHTILTPAFFIVLGGTLLIERLFPAKPNQKIFSVSFAQDLVWFFYETILHAAILVTFVAVISRVYSKYFSFLTIDAVLGFPDWARFLIAALLLDFCYYAQHWVNHKVPWFWLMHTVHHSQKELNFFTDFRYHILEYVVRELFLTIPFLMLKVAPPVIVLYAVFRRWYTRFYHANIRTDLGPLRYVLVTPQSHRIHHSKEPQHRDKNFGSLFSIWDFLFGTQYKGWKEYPDTGIDDEHFPHETKTNLASLITTPFNQMIYPLRVISRQIRDKSSK